MVRLVTADRPDVVCLQEVPVWALGRLAGWSGMTELADVAARPRLGKRPGRLVSAIHHGFFRSSLAGQANAILLAPRLHALEGRRLVLNPRRFRRDCAGALRLGIRARLRWARERRVCQAVRIERSGATTLVVANLHATNHPDRRLPAAEVRRAALFTLGFAGPGEPRVLAGDFNISLTSETLHELMRAPFGYSGAGPGIDHVLVAGAPASAPEVWPVERRAAGGRVLSDHAPVEVRLR